MTLCGRRLVYLEGATSALSETLRRHQLGSASGANESGRIPPLELVAMRAELTEDRTQTQCTD